jgi:putative SOS response-associated peptidase YedK
VADEPSRQFDDERSNIASGLAAAPTAAAAASAAGLSSAADENVRTPVRGGDRVIGTLRWGLIPHWSKVPKIGWEMHQRAWGDREDHPGFPGCVQIPPLPRTGGCFL